MSTHPNVLLILHLTPDDLARKTFREIMNEANATESDARIKIGSKEYNALIMEGDYHDDWQISSREGDILVFDLVTYGYGETIDWEALSKQKEELENWAQTVCKEHSCTFRISVGANYW